MTTLVTPTETNRVTRLRPWTEAHYPLPTVTAVIPTKNEAKNLPHVLPRIPSLVTEVLLVDGNSTDDTIEVARSLRPDIRIVHQTGKGKGNALRTGFEAARGEIIVMLDADGSMAPEEIPAYVGALVAGADYAKGSRFLHGGGTDDMEFHRYLGNLAFVISVRLLFGGQYSDLCYGYCAFWKRVLPLLKLDSDGFEIETEMNVRALRAGIKVTEVPSFESRRIFGESNLRAIQDGMRVLKTILKERATNLPEFGRGAKARLGEDLFTPSMNLLLQEATHLVRRRDEVPAATYQMMVDAIKATFHELLDMEIDDPKVKNQQEVYRRQADSLWKFLEHQAQPRLYRQ